GAPFKVGRVGRVSSSTFFGETLIRYRSARSVRVPHGPAAVPRTPCGAPGNLPGVVFGGDR
ncbi:MAG TPA: hypothetical protein VGP12_05610, partial [Nitrosospira sp.]|nr:hypothetical protein [Nitrosospira sp.]